LILHSSAFASLSLRIAVIMLALLTDYAEAWE